MGQVTKDDFDVSGGSVTFTLNVQDTVGIKEFWIIDFEPYRYNVDRLPVDENTGQYIRDSNAVGGGKCSGQYQGRHFCRWGKVWCSVSGTTLL